MGKIAPILLTLLIVGGVGLLVHSFPSRLSYDPKSFNQSDYVEAESLFLKQKIEEIKSFLDAGVIPTIDELTTEAEKQNNLATVSDLKSLDINSLVVILESLSSAKTNTNLYNNLIDKAIAIVDKSSLFTNIPDLENISNILKTLRIRWEPNLELIAKGRKLYKQMCMTCHGMNGDGLPVTPEAKSFDVVKPRDFSGQSHINKKVIYKFSSAQRDSTPALEEDLKKTIREGLAGTPMPGFESLQDSDVTALIEYIKTFGYLGWKYGAITKSAISIPKVPTILNLPERINSGRETYKSLCLTCHGDIENGGLPAPDKKLDWTDDKGNPLPVLPRNFAFEPLKKGKLADLYQTIKLGIQGTPMPANNLEDEKIWDLVSYIIYLREKASKGELK